MFIRNYLTNGLFFCFISFLIFTSSFIKLSAEEIDWIEVANANKEIQFIDVKSIKYDTNDVLSVITKNSRINPEDQNLMISDSYLLAIDCDKRLFSKLKVNDELKQVKNWENPTNNKLLKKTIVNSCSY